MVVSPKKQEQQNSSSMSPILPGFELFAKKYSGYYSQLYLILKDHFKTASVFKMCFASLEKSVTLEESHLILFDLMEIYIGNNLPFTCMAKKFLFEISSHIKTEENRVRFMNLL